MPFVEIGILILIFALSFWLIRRDFDASLILLLVLSVFLHKEFFSIYRWDVLPVRVFMLAFVASAGLQVLEKLRSGLKKEEIFKFFSDPFIILISAYWLVNALSLIFTENLAASILFFGFQTTMIILGMVLYLRLKDKPEKVLSLIKTYIYITFGLVLFGLIQLVVYQLTGFIFGALWNVHGRLPRIGATFWDVNHFGALLAALLPVLGMFFLLAKKWRERITYVVMLIPMLGMLVMTNSRSAWILAGVAFLVFSLVMLIRRWGMKGIYGLVLALVLISGGLLWEYSDRASPFRKVVRDYFHYRVDSFDAHFLLLQGSYQVFEMFPYLGGGTGGFFEQFSKTDIAPTFFGRDPISLTAGFRAPGHSIWGETLAETGAVGIFVFVLFLSAILLPILYAALTDTVKEHFLLAAGMFSALTGWLFAAVFYSYKSEFFWLIFFLYFLYAVGVLGKKYDFNKIYAYFLKNNKLPYIALAILGVVLIFWGLGRNHFIPWDEAIYAKIAKNMVETGDYITLQWQPGVVWFEKPPLYIWFEVLSMKMLGVSELAARLPSAILGLAAVFLVYSISKRLFNKTTAFISALVLLTTSQYIYYSRAAMMDISVAFFMTFAIHFYLNTIWPNQPNPPKKTSHVWVNWILIGASIGLGAMIKNVVGFLPALVIGINELILILMKERKFNRNLIRDYMIAAISALVIFVPWHLEMWRRFGQIFINNYFFYHVIERGTSEIEQKGRPFWWYLIILKVSMRIWFVALLAAFPFAAVLAFYKKNKAHIFLMVWTLVIFLFFSSAKSKLVWYIVPLYPVLAIMVGNFIERVYNKIISYIPRLGFPIFKSLFIYALAAFALFYIFLVKGIVYPGDATGAQAMLLQKKDETFGLELPVYVDKVELPLIRYYTDGTYVETNFASLKDTLNNADYDEVIVFLTKESRFDTYGEENPNLTLVLEIEDYALGLQDSQYERDSSALRDVKREQEDLGWLISEKRRKGVPVTALELQRVEELAVEEQILTEKIEAGLATLEDNSQSEN
ncbi:hypothetical protein A2886_00800 [candidate division WWE3 bacterium RIFCSPHIGHO2_01_FULL_42_13]|uniref:Uncharacterized protein n=1 Tax=candidate division WWE3 bacterium RIFCSPHIGHO2_01_FULL_42_13 TaxID=1802617 RepID=A0A1F4UQH5_UNCKA|nr:MAG: hypothetical protein A2886_00800 [candidate division WWE3 bacterium RIFCSPHIGHO2_01_FULL_42_13]